MRSSTEPILEADRLRKQAERKALRASFDSLRRALLSTRKRLGHAVPVPSEAQEDILQAAHLALRFCDSEAQRLERKLRRAAHRRRKCSPPAAGQEIVPTRPPSPRPLSASSHFRFFLQLEVPRSLISLRDRLRLLDFNDALFQTPKFSSYGLDRFNLLGLGLTLLDFMGKDPMTLSSLTTKLHFAMSGQVVQSFIHVVDKAYLPHDGARAAASLSDASSALPFSSRPIRPPIMFVPCARHVTLLWCTFEIVRSTSACVPQLRFAHRREFCLP